MKLSNLRLGPVEPGGSPATPISEEREPQWERRWERQWERLPVAPSEPRDIRRGDEPAQSGFSLRRSPGRAVAAVVSSAALLLVAGIVLISTIMADRTMTQRPMPLASSEPSGDASRRVTSGDSATFLPPEPQPWRQPQPRADVAQPAAPVPLAAQPELGPPPASAAAPAPAPAAMPRARPEASPAPDPAMLIARGDEYLARSDVTAARLFYRRAFDGGSIAAATAMGSTFDPIIFEQRNIRGVRADPAEALQWYRRAAQLGDADADTRGLALIAYLRGRAANGDAEARAVLERALR